jgi:hypothetical protein
MTNSSSISNFKVDKEDETGLRTLLRRVAIFMIPLASVTIVVTCLAGMTGEIVPARWVAWAETKHHPFTYLPKFSDHTFYLKLHAAELERPDVLVLGSSRTNQWRSAMFAPYTFYNSGNAIDPLKDFSLFLERMGPPFPKVIIFSLDFFTFNNTWAARFTNLAHGDIEGNEYALILKKLATEIWSNPAVLRAPVDPVYHVPAVGIFANSLGIGFRIDGSFQYGQQFDSSGLEEDKIAGGIERIRQGEEPFQFASGIDAKQLDELKRFADLAHKHSIALVAVTMPYPHAEIEAVEKSDRHGIWKEFERQTFRDWIAHQSIIYFDFTHTESFHGNEIEFIDAFHPTETAYVRMLLSMLKDARFKALLPDISEDLLARKLRTATTYQVFRNEF